MSARTPCTIADVLSRPRINAILHEFVVFFRAVVAHLPLYRRPSRTLADTMARPRVYRLMHEFLMHLRFDVALIPLYPSTFREILRALTVQDQYRLGRALAYTRHAYIANPVSKGVIFLYRTMDDN